MRKTMIVCDRCKKEIHDTPRRIWICTTNRDTGDVDQDAYNPNYDLCENCATQLVIHIENFMSREKEDEPIEAEAPEPEVPEKPKKKRIQIDRGKVKALHDAGWSQAKIADEMKCSQASVCMILKEVSK